MVQTHAIEVQGAGEYSNFTDIRAIQMGPANPGNEQLVVCDGVCLTISSASNL
jgi:hypothetical protein